MYKYFIFDLDGTLCNSQRGIINSIKYACNKWNFHNYTPEELLGFIGPPLHLSFKNKFNLSAEDADAIVRDYRVYYADKGKFENELYDGIFELLQELHNKKYKLAIATSKPEGFTLEILEHFGIKNFFDVVVGSTLDNKFSEKSDIINCTLKQLQPSSKAECLMIGDRKFDIEGAKACGIDCAAVLYGFGNMNEFQQYKPQYIVETVNELRKLITC